MNRERFGPLATRASGFSVPGPPPGAAFRGISRSSGAIAAAFGAFLLLTGPAGASGTRRALPPPDEIAKLPPDGGPHWNRLVFAKSPYLLQHAGNPVDWYPWGEEAFRKAAEEGKPVFLSIGYSTCHWCHVMEHESFEDDEVAALMNESFVAVKVDREERPDVDHIYMEVTQALGGRGGWPLTVIMTPDKRPFFTGTYFPKTGRSNRPGMMELLPQIANAWAADRDRVIQHADRAIQAVRSRTDGPAGVPPGEAALATAYGQLAARYDRTNGGFSTKPKFPVPHNLRFLMRYHWRTGEDAALAMVENTLTRMRRGGIWDHVGYGFHRYSTDEIWLVPHFEKMLYDQALLSMAYTEAFQITGNPEYERTAREIFTYVLRDMTSPEGGFYSAEDADSEGEEGKFYLWQPAEVMAILGKTEGRLFCDVYDVTEGGNFRDPHSGKKANIPHLAEPIPTWAERLGVPEETLRTRLAAARQRLFDARESRIHPLKDDKVLTDWNGLMIAAIAKAARAFDEPSYAEAAGRATGFVLANLRGADGRLLKRWRGGEAGLTATLEDYAFFLWGLLETYETRLEPELLAEATHLAKDLVAHYKDEERGAFYLSPDDGEPLPLRPKESYDGAIPSGNSVAALALLRLSRMTGNPVWEIEAGNVLGTYSTALTERPSIHTQMLEALDFAVGPSWEIVVAGARSATDVREMLRALQRPFVPNKVVLFRGDGAEGERLASIAEFTRDQTSLDGKATAYVCQNFACREPTTDVRKMLEAFGAGPSSP